MKEDNDDNLSELELYLEIECEQYESGPTFCVEIPISRRVFIIALTLAQLEKNCGECDEDKDE